MNPDPTGGPSSRFPGFDVMDRSDTWDTATASVVIGRLQIKPGLRFFTIDEEPTARALLDRLVGQDDEPRVPVCELIDQRLADGETDGWRYDDLPEDAAAWRASLRHLDLDARASGAESFAALGRAEQVAMLEGIRTSERWHDLPAPRLWSLWLRYACAAFYSHPAAWNEIGFGGPAYPVGYQNLGIGGRERWEVAERDAQDPEPWSQRVERARARHLGTDAEP